LIILAVFFGGLLAIGLIVDNLIMPIIVHHGSEFTLPQIVNLPIKVAEKKLKDLKLNLVVTGEEYNSLFSYRNGDFAGAGTWHDREKRFDNQGYNIERRSLGDHAGSQRIIVTRGQTVNRKRQLDRGENNLV
jgi:hypothetical protein